MICATLAGSSPETVVIVPAMRAKTPTGATTRIISTILMMVALRLENRSRRGWACARGRRSRATPSRKARKTTLSISRFRVAAKRAFSGTMSTRGWSGLRSATSAAVSCRASTSLSYCSCKRIRTSSGIEAPGRIVFTSASPMTSATNVVAR